MSEERIARRDLEHLSAGVHTAESFGRSIIAAALAAAAIDAETRDSDRPIPMQVDVDVTPIAGVGAWVCVGVPGFGRICTLERKDRP